MVYAIPWLSFNFNFNLITLLELLNRLQTFDPTHDPTVPEGNFEADERTLVLEADLEVLAPVPVVVGCLDGGSIRHYYIGNYK